MRLTIELQVLLHVLPYSLLGLVSYYVPSGPWKTLWVKFGYDPRTEREAKVYQCLDFRLPKEVDIVESEWNRRTQPAFRPTGRLD